MKLTKANREVVDSIATGFISSMIINVLIQQGEEVTPEIVEGIGIAIGNADTTQLKEQIAEGIVAYGVDLKTVAKVNKYLAQPDVQAVMGAVQAVAVSTNEVLSEVVRDILVSASKAGA